MQIQQDILAGNLVDVKVGKVLGRIEAGKLADIIAVPGNPLDDPSQFGKVHFVMKAGQVYKAE